MYKHEVRYTLELFRNATMTVATNIWYFPGRQARITHDSATITSSTSFGSTTRTAHFNNGFSVQKQGTISVCPTVPITEANKLSRCHVPSLTLVQRNENFRRCNVFRYLRILAALIGYRWTIIPLHGAWNSLRTGSALRRRHKAGIQEPRRKRRSDSVEGRALGRE